MPTTGTTTRNQAATRNQTTAGNQAEIRDCVNKWIRAVRAKDVSALMALYAQDVITFDLFPPSQVEGADSYRKNFERWFSGVSGPIDYELDDLHITANGDVAFCHGLGHAKWTRQNGERSDYWVRVTIGFQNRDDQWLVTHDHVSMPFEMESMKAVSDLQR